MKHIFFSSMMLLLFNATTLFAQRNAVYFDGSSLIKSPEARIGVGLLGGSNRSDMDFGLNGNGWQAGVQLNAVALRFFHINLDVSTGRLEGGPLQIGDDVGNMYAIRFNNQFTQVAGVARILPFRVFMWDRMDHWAEMFTYFYAGIGYGMIQSKVSATPLTQPEFGHQEGFSGSASVFIQEYGVDLPILRFGERSRLFLNIHYRFLKSNSDYLDGFKPTVASNLHNDVYSTYNVGLTYKF